MRAIALAVAIALSTTPALAERVSFRFAGQNVTAEITSIDCSFPPTPTPTPANFCPPGQEPYPRICSFFPCNQRCLDIGSTPVVTPTPTPTRSPAVATRTPDPQATSLVARIAGLDETWRACAKDEAAPFSWLEASNVQLSTLIQRGGAGLPRCARYVWAALFPAAPWETTAQGVANAVRNLERVEREMPDQITGVFVGEHQFAGWSLAAARSTPEGPDPLVSSWGTQAGIDGIELTARTIREVCADRACLLQPYLGLWTRAGDWDEGGGWVGTASFYAAVDRWLGLLRQQYPTVEVSWQISNCSFPGMPAETRRQVAFWLGALNQKHGLEPRLQIEACAGRNFGVPITDCAAMKAAEGWPGTLVSVWPGHPSYHPAIRALEGCL